MRWAKRERLRKITDLSAHEYWGSMVRYKRGMAFAASLVPCSLRCATAWAQSAQDIETAASQAISRHSIQASMPNDVGIDFSLPDQTWLFWVMIVIGVAVVVYSMKDQITFWRPKQEDDWDENAALAPGGKGSQRLAEASASADELARQGRYREAIHLLLLRSLGEMRLRLKEQFAVSMTSREILRRAELASEGRDALHDIVVRVEHCYFGEYPVGADDYAACKTSFDSFVFHLQSGSAA